MKYRGWLDEIQNYRRPLNTRDYFDAIYRISLFNSSESYDRLKFKILILSEVHFIQIFHDKNLVDVCY